MGLSARRSLNLVICNFILNLHISLALSLYMICNDNNLNLNRTNDDDEISFIIASMSRCHEPMFTIFIQGYSRVVDGYICDQVIWARDGRYLYIINLDMPINTM